MKLARKWLFPLLTCLIAAGAAVLPTYLSQLRDARQFGQVHAEALAADALPVREARDQLERLELYARWHTNLEIIPSFRTPVMEEDMDVKSAEQALASLEQAGIIPSGLLQKALAPTGMNRILLWDPADSMGLQQPAEFWKIQVDLGNGSLWVDVDGESGLPVSLSVYDPNMAQWLSYQDPDTLPNLARGYFDLLGLEAHLVEPDPPSARAPWERRFLVEGTELSFRFSFNATMLTIDLVQGGTDSYGYGG